MRSAIKAALVLGSFGLSVSSAGAQSLVPDAHWGANNFPSSTPEVRAGLYFNRFTQFNAEGVRFNQIDETAGFNLLGLTYTDRFPSAPEFSFTTHVGVGVSNDEPTSWLQNDYVHDTIGQGEVPVGNEREQTELVGAFGVTRWFEPSTREEWFIGGGVATSTLYHEPYLNVGVQYFHEGLNLRYGLMYRASTPFGGNAYPDVASFNSLLQSSVTYVPERIPSSTWLGRALGNPEVGLTVTYDSGLFENTANQAIETWFTSLRFKWRTGLAIETWNDIANGSDFGPTFGLMISVDVSTFLRLNV